MAFDGIFLHQIVKQLQSAVTERIVRIYQISDTEILFILKGHQSYQLMVSAHSSYNRIHFTTREYPTRVSPSNFIILLRKYLEGGIITSLKQISVDRYLVMEVNSRNDIGDKINVQLYIELMGKYANIILVHNGKIIDALKHIPPFENTIRTIQPGAIFKPTEPQQGKLNPFEVSELSTHENLFEKLIGFSPILSTEFAYRLNKGQSFQSIMAEVENSSSLYLYEDEKQELFHTLPLTHLSNNYRKMDICEGLDYIYFSKEEKDRIRNITGDLFKFTRRELNKLNSKLNRLLQAQLEAENCDIYRQYGDILYCNLDKVTKGNDQITLEDFDGQLITIPLDNRLDAKANAKKCFNKYHKLSVGKKYLAEQIAIVKEQIEYFNEISLQLEMADFKSALEIKTELQNNGYIKNRNIKQKTKKNLEPNYGSFTINDKTVIYGKNNIQNDFITFKKANRFDYWFHVKDIHGSHVSINSSELTEEEIRICAMIAAYYSKARLSSSVPVNYTQIKNLKKIPGSKIGKVSMSQYKTIYIDIDTGLLERYITLK